MHASTEQLLSLRDGEPVDARVHGHLADCAACAAGLQQLHERRTALRDLPGLQPPPGAWAAIVAAAGPEAVPQRRWRRFAASAAAAAGIVVAVLLLLPPQPQGAGSGQPVAGALRQPAPGADGEVGQSGEAGMSAVLASVAASQDPTPHLVARSVQLESVLAALPAQPRIVNAGTASTIAVLEDRLAVVDYRLSRAAAERLPAGESQKLWRQRVDLMDSLVQVRYAQVQRTDF